MRRLLLSLLSPFAVFTQLVVADVQFTFPGPGAQVPVGPLTVKWTDSGIAPSISQLSTYTLTLWVGGNDASEAASLGTIGSVPGEFSAGNSAIGTTIATMASSLANGFYLEMISTAKDGGTVTNYSDRFTITGMTGVTSAKDIAAVQALGGSTAGPPTINDVAANAGAAAAAPAPAASAPPAGGEFGVPYALQSGLTKYAPMQRIPPTKITQKNATPLFSTSAFDIARTNLPVASIVTTLTESQTFRVQSMQNTAAAQSNPTGDMAKFLARWKD